MSAQPHCTEERFRLHHEGVGLAVFLTRPAGAGGPWPAVQIHHGGGGYSPLYEDLARSLAQRGFLAVCLVHRGFPGSDGATEYGRGEVADIGHLTRYLSDRADVDSERMGILGYSRGALYALLALVRHDQFGAGVLWSPPVDMVRHVQVHPWVAEILGGSPGEVPEAYACRSALPALDRLACPVLILHGAEDAVVPVDHALELARSLEARGKPFELEVLPGEGHVWSTAGFSAVWRRTLGFLERTLQTGRVRS